MALILLVLLPGLPARALATSSLEETVHFLAGLEDRSTGTPGNHRAAAYVRNRLESAGPEKLFSLPFTVPVLQASDATLNVGGVTFAIKPFIYNQITPEKLPPEGITGPLIYVGRGETSDFNGHEIKDSIILMDFESGRNWEIAAALGARALIFVNWNTPVRSRFKEKEELSPIDFPCFWVEAASLGNLTARLQQGDQLLARLDGGLNWEAVVSENIGALFAGTDPDLGRELIIVEAAYDASVFLPGAAPGADEALSISTLLELADILGRNPPKRSFLLLATGARAQSQAGMREAIWCLTTPEKKLRKMTKGLKKEHQQVLAWLEVIEQYRNRSLPPDRGPLFQEAIKGPLKKQIDALTTQLMRLRLESREGREARIRELARHRLQLRRLSWRTSFTDMDLDEKKILQEIATRAAAEHRLVLTEIQAEQNMLQHLATLRSQLDQTTIQAVVSLHLSSQGSGLGAFHEGFLYPLRPMINRTSSYRNLNTVLEQGAARAASDAPPFISFLRPNRLQPWQDLLPDRPQLGGEVASLAGLVGLTLATTGDIRPWWGTPFDTPERINWDFAHRQFQLIRQLLDGLDRAATLHHTRIRNGFATISGRASLLLQGELFPDSPAPGTVILAYQGPARYHVITDRRGRFLLKGVADKKHVLDKVILEGYRFSARNSNALWAIDKKLTGKAAYRIKMRRRSMKTDLVMFPCRQSTIFNLLEPRSFRYLTKMQLIDGRREAPPLRSWYSRLDTRTSTIGSIFLEPRTPFKLTLSDTVLARKMILTNATSEQPMGRGYLIDTNPRLPHTSLLAARDMWNLLGPRIANLEKHGIHNQRIKTLRREGEQALKRATRALAAKRYDIFREQASRSWALASQVYLHVEQTQKDVLFGVLFYIALFVPFAFCMERLLFAFVSIYKRIAAFSGLLLLLIGVISQVHPAFKLAYSPTVVILAFFIIGLSLLVTVIIVARFEQEMQVLQRRAAHRRPPEISAWKAFVAAFFLGVSNLRRRRLRTGLTCLTLVILTFTIMSFTTVKSVRTQNRLLFTDQAPYQGMLLKDIGWNDLPREALSAFSLLFDTTAVISPRIWFQSDEPDRTPTIQIRSGQATGILHGLIGLGATEPAVTGLDDILVAGRWFRTGERNSVLIPSRLAKRIGFDPRRSTDHRTLNLWGLELRIIGVFSEQVLGQRPDLDGEILTPVVFPSDNGMEISEVEKEALESGEDVRSFQGRYRHLEPDQILILPADTLLALGGRLKGVAIKPPPGDPPAQAALLNKRFAMALFSGEKNGVFLYNGAETISYSGMPGIMIPLLISVLIVLNTMISSVHERKREIAVYTSVGLAPTHVSFLFVAEALAFGVISVVLGYLLAQTSAVLLANTPLWQGITVNYSSTAGVAALILVMGVVLLSVIYPSRMAAAIAIPDVNRSWSMPEAREDTIEVTLPFLMRHHEHASICGFLYSYLLGHQDVSHGLFSTGEVELLTDDSGQTSALDHGGGCVHLGAKVWLAPFDFGIVQRVEIHFCPAREGSEFLEIKVSMTRLAGESALWYRANKQFLNGLRKQLLAWRSLDDEGYREYEALFLQAAGNTQERES
ncbi:FtsX-like permease family protein [Desulfolithobacter sp.]